MSVIFAMLTALFVGLSTALAFASCDDAGQVINPGMMQMAVLMVIVALISSLTAIVAHDANTR